MPLFRGGYSIRGKASSAANLFPNQPPGWTQFVNNAWTVGNGTPDFGVPLTTANSTGWINRDAPDQDRLSIANVLTGIATLSTGSTEACDVLTAGPASSPYAFRGRFPITTGSNAPYTIYRLFTAPEKCSKLYVAHYWWIDAQWTNNGNDATKLSWCNGLSASPEGGNENFTAMYDDGFLEFTLSQQGTVTRDMPPNVAPFSNGQLFNKRGQWNLVEEIYEVNSANGVGDGIYKVWINNILTHNYADVNYQITSSPRQWLSYRDEPTYGGGFNNPPFPLFFYFDQTRMAGSN